jgi:hypothetical protein
MAPDPEVSTDEVYYHLDRMECAKITAESKDIVIYTGNYDSDILRKLKSMVSCLDNSHIIQALYYIYAIEELDTIGLKPAEQRFLGDKSGVIDMLLSIQQLYARVADVDDSGSGSGSGSGR